MRENDVKLRKGKFQLKLTKIIYGNFDKIASIKVIYHNTNLGLKESKEIIDTVQYVGDEAFVFQTSKPECKRLQQRFLEVGVESEIVPI